MFSRCVGLENVKTVFDVREVHRANQTQRVTLVNDDLDVRMPGVLEPQTS